jgi:hypothetical protein
VLGFRAAGKVGVRRKGGWEFGQCSVGCPDIKQMCKLAKARAYLFWAICSFHYIYIYIYACKLQTFITPCTVRFLPPGKHNVTVRVSQRLTLTNKQKKKAFSFLFIYFFFILVLGRTKKDIGAIHTP